MFRVYCSAYDKTKDELHRLLKTNTEFKEFCEKVRTEFQTDLIDSLLICPIQRPSRYNLLIRQIIEYTEPGNTQLKKILELKDKFSKVNAAINRAIKDVEMRTKVKEIENSFLKPINIMNPSRVFIKKGEFWKVCRSDNRLYTFWLFNDLLLYGTLNNLGTYKLHKEIALNDNFIVNDLPGTKTFKNVFEIKSETKSFMAYTETVQEKKEWLKLFQDCIKKFRSSEEQRGRKVRKIARTAPVWMPDSYSDTCLICKDPFTLFKRRHHCRICGRLTCSNCRKNTLPDLTGKDVPACNICDEEFSRRQSLHDPIMKKTMSEQFSAKSLILKITLQDHQDIAAITSTTLSVPIKNTTVSSIITKL
eukprot:UN31916